MNNENKDFFISDVDVNVGEEEIILAPPTELIEEAKEIAQNTKSDEKFPFALQYNASQKEFLLSIIKTAGAIVEDDDEEGHVLATLMNMTQLAFIKKLDCVERVKTDEGTNPFLIEEAVDFAQIQQEDESSVGETQKLVTNVNTRTLEMQSVALAEMDQGSEGVAVASVAAYATSTSNNCPTNTDWDSAQEIVTETVVKGCICCQGAEQWFKFTVPETKEYSIYTTGSLDPEGELYDHNHNRIDDETTNIKIDGFLNLRIRCTLSTGVQYYLHISDAKNNTGAYTLKITSEIVVDKVDIISNRSDGVVVLEKGKTYQLPRGDGYDPLNIAGVENAPLSVKVSPNNATDKRVYWYSSSIPTDHVDVPYEIYGDNEVYQTITGHTCGGNKLYARDWFERGKIGTICVAVSDDGSFTKVTKVSLPTTDTMSVGKYKQFTATIEPNNATVSNVSWSSEDTKIVTVSPYGRVRAVAPGKTRIIATSIDGYPIESAACEITVEDPSIGGIPVMVKHSDGLNVASDSSGENLLGTFNNGSTIFLINETPQNGTMFYVYGTMSNGSSTYGWCSGEYLAKETDYAYLKDTDNWHIREKATINSKKMGLLESGSFIKLLEIAPVDKDGYTWHKVMYNSKECYVADIFDREEYVSENYLFVKHWEMLINGQPPTVPTTATNDCLNFIIDYEGKDFFPTVQDDGFGNPTIGYGHLVKANENFTTITKEEALSLFSQDINSFQTTVSNYAKNRSVIWSQQQFDAFVSLCYNIGSDTGDVMDDIIAGTDPYVAFAKFSNANEGFSLGVYRRRMDEADIFVLGDYTREDRSKPM